MASSGQPVRAANRTCTDDGGTRSTSDLHKWLVYVLGEDAAPPAAHLSRLVRTPPERLNLATLDALCVVLAGEPADLLLHRSAAAAAGVAR